MTDPKILTQIATASTHAQCVEGVPAELLFAQCALESGWLQHAPGNNCFGIKSYDGCSGKQLLSTKEWFTDGEVARFLANAQGRTAIRDQGVAPYNGRRRYTVQDWFATFPTLGDCFCKRASLFNVGRYKSFADQWRLDGNLEHLIRGIGPIYATDPQYANTLLKIIGQDNVKTAIKTAKEG